MRTTCGSLSPGLGREVSDEFTVPLCRIHHRDLHLRAYESAWWKQYDISPLAVGTAIMGRVSRSDGFRCRPAISVAALMNLCSTIFRIKR
jgi:hypothetical protein